MATYNPYLPFLEDNPNIMYQGWFSNRGGGSQNFLNYWKNKSSNVYDNYLGQLGGMALNNQSPNLSFYDYLSKSFDPMKEYNLLNPGQRGAYQSGRSIWNV